MKIKSYIQFIKENNEEWKERTLSIPIVDFLNRFFPYKVKIKEDDNYITYSHHDRQYDKEEKEYFWEKKMLIKVDKLRKDITHYYELIIIDRPLYKVRISDMTKMQELTIRTWVGTEKKPKAGKFEGYDKGLAKFRSGNSGKLYHVLPDGDIIEMLDEEKIDDYYIKSIIDYLLDTRNLDLINIVEEQRSK